MAESEGALSKLLDFVVNKDHHLSKRAALMVLLIVGVGLLDNYVGFSDFYAYDHKVEQVAKIETILRQTDLDSSVRGQLQRLEHQILERKSWPAYLPSLPSLTSFINEPSTSNAIQPQKTERAKIILIERDLFWHTLTSAWPVFILMIGFLVYTITKKIDATTLVSLLLAELFCVGLAYGASFLFSLIPVLLGNPIYNYLMNFSLSTMLFFGSIWIGGKINQK